MVKLNIKLCCYNSPLLYSPGYKEFKYNDRSSSGVDSNFSTKGLVGT